jgi:hypothetical protein
MREQEMRQRVFRFLKARMRNMIMPATMGLGLAVVGCSEEGVTPVYAAPIQDAAIAQKDAPSTDSPVPGPDTSLADKPGPDTQIFADVAQNTDVSLMDVGKPDASGGEAGQTDSLIAVDSNIDLGPVITKYIAPQPDASAVDGSRDTALDSSIITKYIAPVYIAPLPDAGPTVEKYSALLPDVGLPVLRYMAQIPDPDTGIQPLYSAPMKS